MTQKDWALQDFRRAELILAEAHAYREKGAWNLVVRRSQEAVELALKAALRFVGVDPPRVHDVGPSLREHASKFPPNFAAVIPKLASISRALRNERETSLYGEPDTGTPPEALFLRKTLVRLWRRQNLCLRFVGNCWWGGMSGDRFA